MISGKGGSALEEKKASLCELWCCSRSKESFYGVKVGVAQEVKKASTVWKLVLHKK